MKTLKLALGAALAVGLLTAPGNAATAPPAPYPAAKVAIPMYVDTVSSSRGEVRNPRVCTQTNYFARKSRVVFRMWAMDSKTGEAITPLETKYVYIKIPGQPNLKMNFGPHGAVGKRVNFWSAAWAIPADYPLGVVPFRVVLKTEDNIFGIFKQSTLDGAQLTVTP